MATDKHEFPDVREMTWLRRVIQAWKASRNIQMYQDLALASLIADRDEKQSLVHLQFAVWWYHRMNALRGVTEKVMET